MSRKNEIIRAVHLLGPAGISDIFKHLQRRGEDVSLVTARRDVQRLVADKRLSILGAGRGTKYSLTPYGMLTDEVDANGYCALEPDIRYGQSFYNFEILQALDFDPFTTEEKTKLEEATAVYKKRVDNLSDTIRKKELERFIIELSWKSSKIEGSTYALLDTERLIHDAVEAPGHSHAEALMILNHKKAFDYIIGNVKQFALVQRKDIEDVHKLLVTDLGVTHNLRKNPVGVIGSRYTPLDNEHQIAEAIDVLSESVNMAKDARTKALFLIAGIGYIQPFEDGNKRTSRLMTNAVLLAHGMPPLSYRSVSEEEYREATLVFYELNSLVPLKKLFIEQYVFAANNYAVIG